MVEVRNDDGCGRSVTVGGLSTTSTVPFVGVRQCLKISEVLRRHIALDVIVVHKNVRFYLFQTVLEKLGKYSGSWHHLETSYKVSKTKARPAKLYPSLDRIGQCHGGHRFIISEWSNKVHNCKCKSCMPRYYDGRLWISVDC